jgi:hypothetical protein
MYSFGTDGMWKFLFWMAALGVATLIIGTAAGLIWIFMHLKWVS